jgi:hypothetical protein
LAADDHEHARLVQDQPQRTQRPERVGPHAVEQVMAEDQRDRDGGDDGAREEHEAGERDHRARRSPRSPGA